MIAFNEENNLIDIFKLIKYDTICFVFYWLKSIHDFHHEYRVDGISPRIVGMCCFVVPVRKNKCPSECFKETWKEIVTVNINFNLFWELAENLGMCIAFSCPVFIILSIVFEIFFNSFPKVCIQMFLPIEFHQ